MIVDDRSRECIATDIDFSFPSLRVIQVLQRLGSVSGLPTTIKRDNGGEVPSDNMLKWAGDHNADLHFIEPSRPMQNGNVESFNGRPRDEFLNKHASPTIFHARMAIEEWRHDYNNHRPHSALDGSTPSEFVKHRLILTCLNKWPDLWSDFRCITGSGVVAPSPAFARVYTSVGAGSPCADPEDFASL